MRIILLCSGNLGLVVLKQLHITEQLVFVFTDSISVSIIDYVREHNIPFYKGNPRKEVSNESFNDLSCDILLSVNYLFIVGPEILCLAKKYAINFHGSLLPKYRGRTPHVWAIINGENETGISAHLMTNAVDDGPIVKQVRIVIESHDTGATVLGKFNSLYPTLVADVLNDIRKGQLTIVEQDHSKATYFSKRTPEDGEINWNWQKERIYNWVRAQSKPYPGAYTFLRDEKIIIHEIQFCEVGFSCNDDNGKILANEDRPVIKTPNGAIKLVVLEANQGVLFKKGEVLHGRN